MHRMSAGRRGRRSLRLLVTVGTVVATGLLTALTGASSGAPAPKPTGTADLSITKSDSPDPVAAGGALTYSIAVKNAGPNAATNVVVTDDLPKGVTFVSAVPSQGTCAPSSNKGLITCRLGTIGVTVSPTYVPGGPAYIPGAATIAIQVIAPRKAGTISNTASVEGDQADPKRGNNAATAKTHVTAPAPQKKKRRRPTCGGRRATLLGTSGADLLIGTPRRDVVLARRGRDRIITRGGRDLICAGAGRDVVKAGGGRDKVFGGRGGDRLFGMRGADTLRGGAGPDRLVGGPGNDSCFGGPGRNVFRSC
jgi:uncharacterized repeat protein (TIGR01451 family)